MGGERVAHGRGARSRCARGSLLGGLLSGLHSRGYSGSDGGSGCVVARPALSLQCLLQPSLALSMQPRFEP
jgi:hypothetical protein